MNFKKYFFTTLLLSLFFSPFTAYPQSSPGDSLVTIHCDEMPLRSILNLLSRQGNITFVYDDLLIKDKLKFVDIKATTLANTLKIIFKDTNIDYKRINQNQFVLFKAVNSRINVYGSVYDATSGESLPFANIQIKDSHLGTITNQQGHFTLLNVPRDKTVLIFQYIGYEPRTIDLKHFDKNLNDLEIGLEQMPLISKEITVNANLVKMFNVEKEAGKCAISPNQLASLPAIGDKDVSRTLQLLPGISTNNYGGSGVNIRGGLASENLVLLDGMPLYHMYHSFGYFSAFNSSVIKDVRIYKGGFPANYGGRTSGVLNLTIKDGNFNKPKASFGINQMATHGVLELPLFGKGALLLSARGTISDFITGDLFDKVFVPLSRKISPIQYDQKLSAVTWDTTKFSNIYFYDLLSKLTLNPDKSNLYTLSFYKSKDLLKSENLTALSQYIESWTLLNNKNQDSNWGNTGFSGQWYHEWTHKVNSTLQAAYSDYHTKYDLLELSDTRYENDGSQTTPNQRDNWDLLPTDSTIYYSSNVHNDLTDQTVRIDNSFKVNEKQNYEFGLCYTNYQIEYRLNDLLNLNGSNEPEHISQDADAEIFTHYIQNNWKATKHLLWDMGLRTSYYTPTKTIYFEPRLSVNYSVSDHIILKTAWGKYNQFILQAYEGIEALDGHISWVLADGDHWQPASSVQTIAGIQYNTLNYSVDLELYTKKMDGELNPLYYSQYTDSDSSNTIQPQNSTTVNGIDFLIHKKAGQLNGWLGYTYSQSESRFFQNGSTFYRPTSHNSPHKINIVLNYNLPLFELSMTWNYASGRPYSVPKLHIIENDDVNYYLTLSPETYNNERLAGTQRIDFSVKRSLKWKHYSGDASISVFNVLNQDNIWYRYFIVKDGELYPVDVYTFGTTFTFSLEVNL